MYKTFDLTVDRRCDFPYLIQTEFPLQNKAGASGFGEHSRPFDGADRTLG